MHRREALAKLAALAVMAIAPWPARAAPRLRAAVDVDRSMVFGTITIKAYVDVPVASQTAWLVLTDYDHLAEFVPDMHLSRIISKPGEPLRVHQRGEKSWLMLDSPFEVVLQLDETPSTRIGFRRLAGSVKDMKGEWRLRPIKDWVRVSYTARVEPGLLSPRMPGDSMLIESDISRMLEALGQEMLRRQAGSAQQS
jgi:hypothetical protein